jgi:hypothetical protein
MDCEEFVHACCLGDLRIMKSAYFPYDSNPEAQAAMVNHTVLGEGGYPLNPLPVAIARIPQEKPKIVKFLLEEGADTTMQVRFLLPLFLSLLVFQYF